MTTERKHLKICGLGVEVVRKEIKNLHVGVYPPRGRVRVAAPLRMDDEAVRLAVVSRVAWIRRQRRGFKRQDRQSHREMVTGESHYYLGRRYLLKVVEHRGPARLRLANARTLELRIGPGADRDRRHEALSRWYRRQLRDLLPPLLAKWEEKAKTSVAEVRIKRMKTRWGSCNAEARRIWLNLELIKKPVTCLEYILVHEMVHLHERHHNERFMEMMDRWMPTWRHRREVLNREPLAHEDWSY